MLKVVSGEEGEMFDVASHLQQMALWCNEGHGHWLNTSFKRKYVDLFIHI